MPPIYDNRMYISVLTPPSQNTELALVLEDFDFHNTFVFPISAIHTTDTEVQLSHKINTQLNTFFQQNDIYFNGIPSYVDLPARQQYISSRTDHVSCVWAQSNFVITASGNTTGAILQINNQPTLLTVADIKDLAPMKGVDLSDNDGDPLTDVQIATLSKLASSKLIAFTKNPIVLSHYLMSYTADYQWGIRLKKTPVVDFYSPQVRQPIAFNLFSAVQFNTQKQMFALERDGWLTYRYAQNIVAYPEPFDRLNDVLLVYLSGWSTIPPDIENAILEILPLVQAQVIPGVESMSGGTFKISFGDYQKTFTDIMFTLQQYWSTDA